jgi:hypothetical protein
MNSQRRLSRMLPLIIILGVITAFDALAIDMSCPPSVTSIATSKKTQYF